MLRCSDDTEKVVSTPTVDEFRINSFFSAFDN